MGGCDRSGFMCKARCVHRKASPEPISLWFPLADGRKNADSEAKKISEKVHFFRPKDAECPNLGQWWTVGHKKGGPDEAGPP